MAALPITIDEHVATMARLENHSGLVAGAPVASAATVLAVEVKVDEASGTESLSRVRQLWLDLAEQLEGNEAWLPSSELLEQLLATGVDAQHAARARAAAALCGSGSGDAEVTSAYRLALLSSAHAVVDALNDTSLPELIEPSFLSVTVGQAALIAELAHLILPVATVLRPSAVRPDAAPRRKKDPLAPKAPISSYIFFCNAARPGIKALHPGGSLGEVGKELGERWRHMGEADRAPWNARAALDKLRYHDEMEAFRGTGVAVRVCTALTVRPGRAGGGGEDVGGGGHVSVTVFVQRPSDRSRLWAARQPGSLSSVAPEGHPTAAAGEHSWPLVPASALFCAACVGHHRAHTCGRSKRRAAAPAAGGPVASAATAVPAAAAVRLPPPKKKARDPHGPKQPWTAFNLFSVEEGRRVSGELREGGRGGFGKELGERWRRLSAEEREPWKELERQDKARYEAELATYLASPSRVTCSPPTVPAAPTIAAALSVHTGLHTGGTPHVALSLALRRADLANLPAHLPASSALLPPSVGLRSTPQPAEAAAALLPYFESDSLASAAGQADYGGSSAPATQLVLAEAIPGGAPAKGAPARRRRESGWSAQEESRLEALVTEYRPGSSVHSAKWQAVAEQLGTGRTLVAVRGHWYAQRAARERELKPAAPAGEAEPAPPTPLPAAADAGVTAAGGEVESARPAKRSRRSSGSLVRWSEEEEARLGSLVAETEPRSSAAWQQVAEALGSGRSGGAVLQHWQILGSTQPGGRETAMLVRWGGAEEEQLRALARQRNPRSSPSEWQAIAAALGTGRTGGAVLQHWHKMEAAARGNAAGTAGVGEDTAADAKTGRGKGQGRAGAGTPRKKRAAGRGSASSGVGAAAGGAGSSETLVAEVVVATEMDVSQMDASQMDASQMGASQAGVSVMDASQMDVTHVEASLVDASLVDASIVDTSLVHASLVNASVAAAPAGGGAVPVAVQVVVSPCAPAAAGAPAGRRRPRAAGGDTGGGTGHDTGGGRVPVAAAEGLASAMCDALGELNPQRAGVMDTPAAPPGEEQLFFNDELM